MFIQSIAEEFYTHLLYMKGYSKATIRRYRHIIRQYSQYTNIDKIENVTTESIRALLLYGRMERKWKPKTTIIFCTTLNVFFRWCITKKYIVTNPVQNIELPKLEKHLPPKLSKQEAHKLLEVVYNYPYNYRFLRYRNHAMFSTCLFAGLRRGELVNLLYSDVDIENLTIFIRQGKGKKDRVVPISHALDQSLRSYLIERKRLNKTCPQFFTSLNRNTGIGDTGLKLLVDKIKAASKINFTIHKLRHTFATLMLEGGCDIYSLSKMMGHSDITTTTIYLAASAEHLRGQIMKHPLNFSSA